MSVLNPWLLLGTLGIGLPVLAHLLNRYKVKQTDWAAMRFLNRSVRIRSRQLRLKDLLLLLLRCCALILLVLAACRPAANQAGGIVSRLGERRAGVVIAVDASFSMQHKDGGATRFDRALDTVREIAAGMVPGAPVSLVLLGDDHRVMARNMAFDEDRFARLLEDLAPTYSPLRMETMPGELGRLAAEIEAAHKEVYLVTDMQARDWAEPAPWLVDGLTRLQQDATVFIMPVNGTPDNLAITDFALFSGLLRKGTMARYRATVRNNSPDPAVNVRIRCLMNGVNVDSRVIPQIAGRTSQSVSFFVPFHNAGAVKLSAQLAGDALPVDDIRYAVANVRERVSVLCVEGKSQGSGLENFIVDALQARGKGTGKEEFTVRSIPWLSLPSQDIGAYDVVILSDVPEITKVQAQQLRDHVKKGSGLIWFAGDNVKPAVWNERSAMQGGALLPAEISQTESISDEKGAGRPLDPILPAHPVCRPLRSLPKDLLSETQFHKRLAVKPRPNSTAVLQLSGSPVPILLEQSVGRGHVFMFTTSADLSWNNMALTPAFPMLVQQMVTYLTGREFERAQQVGGSLSLSYPDRPDASDGVFQTPSDEIIRVPVREHAGQYVALLEQAKEPGFYEARVSVQSPGQPIAVNVDTQESDVRCLDTEEAQNALQTTEIIITSSPAEAEQARMGCEFSRALMIACLVLLIMDSLVAANVFRRKRGAVQP